MKNTPENKAKFFAQYYLQKALRNHGWNNNVESIKSDFIPSFSSGWYLELKPLSQISDENLLDIERSLFNTMLEMNRTESLRPSYADYLRSKCYALDWNGITVEEQIEFGWIKLKNNDK